MTRYIPQNIRQTLALVREREEALMEHFAAQADVRHLSGEVPVTGYTLTGGDPLALELAPLGEERGSWWVRMLRRIV